MTLLLSSEPRPAGLPTDIVSAALARIDDAMATLPAAPARALQELQLARALLNGLLLDQQSLGDHHPQTVLTARERQVLVLLAEGQRNKEIALVLKLRERTVKFHVANLLQKLGVQSRTEALRRAIELNLLPGYSSRTV